MKTLLNIIWLVFGGLLLALGYFVAGVVCCMLIVTIPWGLAAFRIAGGILLLFLGLDMARGDFLAMFADKDALADTKDVRGYARRRFQRLVVPFAIPLMIGPGAISAVIIQAGEAAKLGYAGTMGSLAAITAACAVSFVCFALTGSLSRLLGEVGMAIIVKVLGLILCALAIQFILLGLGEAIPGMISGAVTTPDPALK
jgi:multiple antibiotic resistance protein